jgi:signal transduction histidine kinase
MLREIFGRGLFYWLRAPRHYEHVRHDEWALAIGRVLLSASCCGAVIWLKKPELDLKLSFAYLVYSLLILLALRIYFHWNPAFHIAVHFADIIWVAHLTILISQPTVVFALLLFVMASTAARWGFWESMLTAISLCLLLLMGYFLYDFGGSPQLKFGNIFELFPRILFLFAVAAAVGLLAEAKAARSEGYALSRGIRGIELEAGFEKVLQGWRAQMLQLFGATQVLVAVHHTRTGQTSLFRTVGSQAVFESTEIPPSQYGQYFFTAPSPCWRLACTHESNRLSYRFLRLDAGKVLRDKMDFRPPDAFLAAHPFRVLLAAAPSLGDELSLRAFLIDPMPLFGGTAGLRFLERGMREAASLVHDLFLADRLQIKAEAEAGSRIARELHDGVIQSLAVINLQLDNLRQQISPIFPPAVDSLVGIQERVREEIAVLREFMQQLRLFEIDCSHFLDHISNLAVKFQCESGITARFIPEVDEIRLQPYVCAELARIVQEALVNVRKHSKASEVFIRLGRRNGNCVIGIIDNGHGFGFSGHYSHDELQASGMGPAVIMERARGIHAELSIESIQGRGSCLEITIPQMESADESGSESDFRESSRNKP